MSPKNAPALWPFVFLLLAMVVGLCVLAAVSAGGNALAAGSSPGTNARDITPTCTLAPEDWLACQEVWKQTYNSACVGCYDSLAACYGAYPGWVTPNPTCIARATQTCIAVEATAVYVADTAGIACLATAQVCVPTCDYRNCLYYHLPLVKYVYEDKTPNPPFPTATPTLAR